MYEVKPYIEQNKVQYYGVYIKNDYNSYKLPLDDNDNLVILCYSRAIAETIMELLEDDHKLEDKDKFNI